MRSFASVLSTQCNQGMYFCSSNYFVRTFSGLDNRYTTDEDMLEKAKLNFLRLSCVVVVEYRTGMRQ